MFFKCNVLNLLQVFSVVVWSSFSVLVLGVGAAAPGDLEGEQEAGEQKTNMTVLPTW